MLFIGETRNSVNGEDFLFIIKNSSGIKIMKQMNLLTLRMRYDVSW